MEDNIWCPHGIDREEVECEDCDLYETEVEGTGDEEDE